MNYVYNWRGATYGQTRGAESKALGACCPPGLGIFPGMSDTEKKWLVIAGLGLGVWFLFLRKKGRVKNPKKTYTGLLGGRLHGVEERVVVSPEQHRFVEESWKAYIRELLDRFPSESKREKKKRKKSKKGKAR